MRPSMQVEGRNEMEKDKKRCVVWVIGCDFRDLRRMEGQLAEHLVFFLIFKLVRSGLLCDFRDLRRMEGQLIG